MSDMGSLIGIDRGVLDDQFVRNTLWFRDSADELVEDCGAVKKDIEIAGSRNFDSGNAGLLLQVLGKAGSQLTGIDLLTRRRLDAFREFEGYRERQIAKLDARRNL